jgi:ABC-type transporter Mla subunit MlaD
MPDLDVEELARSLEKTAAGLERHIAAEAQKRANKLAVEYAKAADERIKQNAADMQRLEDLVREFRHQRAPLERAADKAQRLASEIRRAHYNGEQTISVERLLGLLNAPEPSTPEGSQA